jgi:hypothetical protein
MVIEIRNANIGRTKMNTEGKYTGFTSLYVRVSTVNQIDRDYLKTQEDRLIAFCKANGANEYRIIIYWEYPPVVRN